MPPEKSEMEKELGEIRKEVIESRTLVIKTDNLLKNLHAELKMVGKRQDDFQRRQWVSSGVVYVAFAVIAVGGGLLIASARTSGAGVERERLERQASELGQQIEKQRAEAQALATAQRGAADVYRALTTLPGDERIKGVEQLSKLDTSKLSPLERQLLTDRAKQVRQEIGQVAFERGKAEFRRNDMEAAASNLSRFVATNPAPPDLQEASYFLGVAYNQLRKHAQAVPLLARYVAEDRKARNRDYAMLLLAQSYQETAQPEKAAQTARDGLAQYPGSEFAPQMKGRLSAAVKRLQGGGEVAAAPVGAAAPAAAAPAAPVGAAAPAATAPAAPAAAAPAPAARPPPQPEVAPVHPAAAPATSPSAPAAASRPNG